MQFKYLWCTSQQTFHVPCLLFAMSHGTTTENIYLHWLSLTSIENRSHISSPSWDYLKNHGMCDVSSTVICFSRSLLILWAEFRLRFLKNSAVIWSIMGLPEESWHLRCFEYSYLLLVEASWFCEQNSDWDSWRIQLPSGPSWDYLKNHGMFDISSTVISSMSSLVLELWHFMSLFTVWRCPPEDSPIWRISWKMTQF